MPTPGDAARPWASASTRPTCARRMVERLRREGVSNARVLAAFAAVPRHLFVDAALATQAYEDTSLPIGHGQTISKPSVVARMLELLSGGANARAAGDLGAVLEIGTGCGYQAALLAEAGKRVVSVERVQALHEKARDAARADAHEQASPGARRRHARPSRPERPYDSIIAAAGASSIPARLARAARGRRPPGLAGAAGHAGPGAGGRRPDRRRLSTTAPTKRSSSSP